MKPIYLFIICCIAALVSVILTLTIQWHFACMIGTFIGIIALVLTMETFFKEKREKEEKMFAQIVARDKMIRTFMGDFNIDKSRAERLYYSGFKKLEDFKGKSVQELMAIDEINPTLAKKIVQRVEGL